METSKSRSGTKDKSEIKTKTLPDNLLEKFAEKATVAEVLTVLNALFQKKGPNRALFRALDDILVDSKYDKYKTQLIENPELLEDFSRLYFNSIYKFADNLYKHQRDLFLKIPDEEILNSYNKKFPTPNLNAFIADLNEGSESFKLEILSCDSPAKALLWWERLSLVLKIDIERNNLHGIMQIMSVANSNYIQKIRGFKEFKPDPKDKEIRFKETRSQELYTSQEARKIYLEAEAIIQTIGANYPIMEIKMSGSNSFIPFTGLFATRLTFGKEGNTLDVTSELTARQLKKAKELLQKEIENESKESKDFSLESYLSPTQFLEEKDYIDEIINPFQLAWIQKYLTGTLEEEQKQTLIQKYKEQEFLKTLADGILAVEAQVPAATDEVIKDLTSIDAESYRKLSPQMITFLKSYRTTLFPDNAIRQQLVEMFQPYIEKIPLNSWMVYLTEGETTDLKGINTAPGVDRSAELKFDVGLVTNTLDRLLKTITPPNKPDELTKIDKEKHPELYKFVNDINFRSGLRMIFNAINVHTTSPAKLSVLKKMESTIKTDIKILEKELSQIHPRFHDPIFKKEWRPLIETPFDKSLTMIENLKKKKAKLEKKLEDSDIADRTALKAEIDTLKKRIDAEEEVNVTPSIRVDNLRDQIRELKAIKKLVKIFKNDYEEKAKLEHKSSKQEVKKEEKVKVVIPDKSKETLLKLKEKENEEAKQESKLRSALNKKKSYKKIVFAKRTRAVTMISKERIPKILVEPPSRTTSTRHLSLEPEPNEKNEKETLKRKSNEEGDHNRPQPGDLMRKASVLNLKDLRGESKIPLKTQAPDFKGKKPAVTLSHPTADSSGTEVSSEGSASAYEFKKTSSTSSISDDNNKPKKPDLKISKDSNVHETFQAVPPFSSPKDTSKGNPGSAATKTIRRPPVKSPSGEGYDAGGSSDEKAISPKFVTRHRIFENSQQSPTKTKPIKVSRTLGERKNQLGPDFFKPLTPALSPPKIKTSSSSSSLSSSDVEESPAQKDKIDPFYVGNKNREEATALLIKLLKSVKIPYFFRSSDNPKSKESLVLSIYFPESGLQTAEVGNIALTELGKIDFNNPKEINLAVHHAKKIVETFISLYSEADPKEKPRISSFLKSEKASAMFNIAAKELQDLRKEAQQTIKKRP